MSTEQRLKRVETNLRRLVDRQRERERAADETLFYLLTGKRARR
jgi:hypothetical protein